MKKRAKIILVSAIILFGVATKQAPGQDTIHPTPFLPSESFKTMADSWGIMEQAFEEQFKNLPADSIKYYMKLMKEQMKNLPDPMVIPDHISQSYGNNFDRDVSTTTVNLTGESKSKEIIVQVEKEVPVMFLNIKGGIKSGRINIEIHDPNNKKQGGFSLENDSNLGDTVHGSINKTIKEPILGIWRINIESEKAYGNTFVTSIQKL